MRSTLAFRIAVWVVGAIAGWVLLGLVARSLGYYGFGFSEAMLLLTIAAIGVPVFVVLRLLWRLGNPR